jgi:hypothetical protein
MNEAHPSGERPGGGSVLSLVGPRHTAFTVTSWRAISRARDLEKETIAPFAPDCAVSSVAPIFAESDTSVMMRPYFVLLLVVHEASHVIVGDAVREDVDPAQPLHRRIHGRRNLVPLRDVRGCERDVVALFAEGGRQLLALLLSPGTQGDRRPFVAEPAGHRRTGPAERAENERLLSLEIHLPSSCPEAAGLQSPDPEDSSNTSFATPRP